MGNDVQTASPNTEVTDPALERDKLIARAFIQSLPSDLNFLSYLANHYNDHGIVNMKRVNRILGPNLHTSALNLFRAMIRDGLMNILSVCR